MRHRRWTRPARGAALFLALGLLGSCGRAVDATTGMDTGMIPLAQATPTVRETEAPTPTAVPGSTEDEAAAAAVLKQFGEAVARGDEVVALLLLTPSAQQRVASGDWGAVLGVAEPPQGLRWRAIQVQQDTAIAEVRLRTGSGDHAVALRLVRLEGRWQIDGHVDGDPAAR